MNKFLPFFYSRQIFFHQNHLPQYLIWLILLMIWHGTTLNNKSYGEKGPDQILEKMSLLYILRLFRMNII